MPLAVGTGWTGVTDPVWGSANLYTETDSTDDGVVTDETELLAAIAAANDDMPYIIPIFNDISLTSAISIATPKNIVLRKVKINPTPPVSGEYATAAPDGKYILHKTWDYSKNYITTKLDETNGVTADQVNTGAQVIAPGTTVASPDLYDGEPDLKIFNKDGSRHITLTANSDIVLENITLDCGSDWYWDTSAHAGVNPSTKTQGGILIDADNLSLTFAGNIANRFTDKQGNASQTYCGAISSGIRGGIHLTILGGALSHNAGYFGAAVMIFSATTNSNTSSLSISGHTIIENNAAENEAAVYLRGGGGGAEISGDVTLRYNTAQRGPAAVFLHGEVGAYTFTFTAAKFIGNISYGGTAKSTSQMYPGSGGAIAAVHGTTIVINDGTIFDGNIAERGGGAIALDADSYLIINGGVFKNNKALGTSRELASGATPADINSIGGGGAIFPYDITKVSIPSSSTVTFANNTAEYLGVLRTDELNAGTAPGYPGYIYNNYIETSTADTGSSSRLVAPYDNLMNNYDIGIPRDLTGALYTETTLKTIGQGQITQDPSQQESYYDLFGDGRIWTHPEATLGYTAVPQAGNVFSGWTYTSDTPITGAEAQAAFGASSASDLDSKLASPTISFTVPTVHVTLTANFATAAHIAPLSALIFNMDYVSGYPAPAAKPLPLTATGGTPATGVSVSLSNFSLNGNAYTGADPFTILSGDATIAAGGTNSSWEVRPASGLSAGVYAATVTVSYQDGTGGAAVVLQTDVAFVLSQTNQASIVSIASDLDFDPVFEGYASVAPKSLTLQNYGDGIAQVTSVGFGGANADAFVLTPASDTRNLPARTNATTPSTDTYWSIAPKSGLSAGTYTTNVLVIYDGKATSKTITFRVQSSAALSAANVVSPTRETGYAAPAFSPINITNTGQGGAEIVSIVSAANTASAGSSPFSVSSTLTPFVGGGGTNVANLIAPKTGLGVGTYKDTFTITYTTVGDSTQRTAIFTATFVVSDYVWLSKATVDGTANTVTSTTLTLTFAKPMKMSWGDLQLSGAAAKDGTKTDFTSVSADLLTYVVPITLNRSGIYEEGDEIIATITLDPAKTIDVSDPRYPTYQTYQDIIDGPLLGNDVLSAAADVHMEYHSLTYDKGDAGSGTPPATGSYADAYIVTLPGNTGGLTKTGYSFAGWTGAGGALYAAGDKLAISADTTLTASFAPNKYRLIFDPNGGTVGAVGYQAVTYDAAIASLPAAKGDIPTKTNAEFKGWSYQSGESNTVNVAPGAVYATPGDTTVYAVWNQLYALNYDRGTATSGTPPSGGSYQKDASVTVSGNPEKLALPGYSFAGWRSSADGRIYLPGSTIKLTGFGTVLIAIFTPNNYTLRFDPNGGIAGRITSKAVTYDAPIGELPAMTGDIPGYAGYVFKGWSSRPGASNTADVSSGYIYRTAGTGTVYAVWSKILTAPPSVKSLKASMKKIKGKAGKTKVNLALSWKPVTGAQGYEIRYTSDAKFKKGIKTILVKSGTAKSVVIKNVKKPTGKNKYYAKIRAYALDGAGKIYGNYPALTGLKVKAGKGKATVSWKPTLGAQGYVIEYTPDKTFNSGIKKLTVKNGAKKQAVIKKLQKKKTYYVRICAYQKIGGETFYDDYAKVKKVKIK